MAFPESFRWGAATSAYQIEGSPLADGAGSNIWHRFSHTPGRVHLDQNGDVACDHYRLWEKDVALMRELGLQAYRLSIAWARVLPDGTGKVNGKGLDFYKRLIDRLRESDIEPFVTLYHWDLPSALDDRGGWLNRDIAGWFGDYAEVMFRALDGQVRMWTTLNEPWVVMDGGYLHGVLAPGHNNVYEAPLVTHNLLRAHGEAVRRYRAIGQHQIGLVVNLEPKTPASDGPEDVAATERAHAYFNEQYLDPVFRGSYPPALAEMFGEAWPQFPSSDFDVIRERIDFVGVNYYKRGLTRNDPERIIDRARSINDPARTRTDMEWEVHPPGLTDILLWVTERYGRIPLYVTENGAAFYDPPTARDGRIEDPLRRTYLRDHIAAVGDALAGGADMRGYFVWSLLDNFEWSQGYSKRLGIVHVNYATQERTIKDSGRFYSEVIRTNGAKVRD